VTSFVREIEIEPSLIAVEPPIPVADANNSLDICREQGFRSSAGLTL
jgi:hypothetical protein